MKFGDLGFDELEFGEMGLNLYRSQAKP